MNWSCYKSRMSLKHPALSLSWMERLAEMRGLPPLRHVCHWGLFTSLLVFFSFMSFTAAVSFDLTELRNKVAKIKVNPRGNLWATGHFMGKKSVMDAPPLLLPSSAEDQGEVNPPAEHNSLWELFQHVLRVDTHESRSNNQEADLWTKILENYIQSRK